MVVTQVFLFLLLLLNIEGTAQREWSELTDRGQVSLSSRRALPPRRTHHQCASHCFPSSPVVAVVTILFKRVIQGHRMSTCMPRQTCAGGDSLLGTVAFKCHFCPLQLSQIPPAVQGGPPGARQPQDPRLKPQLDGGKHRWRHLCNGTPRWDILCSKYDKIMRAR